MPAESVLDLTRYFLPESLAGLAFVDALDEGERRALNQIRAVSYLHVFDVLEKCLGDALRSQGARSVDARELLAPLLRFDAFDHGELFHRFERAFERSFPVRPKQIPRPLDLDAVLEDAVPLSLLVIALHLKLVTQQHYLACVRGDEGLEPAFVDLLKVHWATECGRSAGSNPTLEVQRALSAALPGRVPAALRDYKRIVLQIDDVLERQAELDLQTLEETVRRSPDRAAILAAQVDAYRKTFLTFGIANAAFVYAMRNLGPSAPAALAGVVAALRARS